MSAGQYATFLVGDRHLGIGVTDVQEVLRDQPVTPVPLAPPVVAGLINLRGQIVPELDLRRMLRLPPRESTASSFSIVVRSETGAVSLLADEIDDVLELDASAFDEPPQNVDPEVRGLLLGVCRMPEKLLLVLDVRRTVDVGGD